MLRRVDQRKHFLTTSTPIRHPTWQDIPEDVDHQKHLCANLKSRKSKVVSVHAMKV